MGAKWSRQMKSLPQEELNVVLLNLLLGLKCIQFVDSEVHERLWRAEESRLAVVLDAEQAANAERCAKWNACVVRAALRELLVELGDRQLASSDSVVDVAEFDVVSIGKINKALQKYP